MAYDGSIRINTKIDTAGFTQGASKIKQGIGDVSQKVGGLVKKLGMIAGIAGLGAFAKSALDAASDLQEVQNVVDTAFGSMSQKCEDFAKSALDNFGLSEYAAKKMSSTYMAMGKSMGLSMDYASDMAISVSERTADMASFYNLTAEEAATKMKSIYTGETESLKALGVVMTEDNLKQYALSQGIEKSYKDMDQAEKVMLRYGYVMQSTSDAAGDFARTSDSWANQTKKLAENFGALKTTVGDFLITVLSPGIKALNNMVQVITNVVGAVKVALADLFGIQVQDSAVDTGAAVADVSDGMGDLTTATDKQTTAQKKNNKEQQKALASFDKLNKLNAKTTDSGSGSGSKNKGGSGGGGGSFTVPITKSDNALKKAGKSLDSLTGKIKKLVTWVKKLITPLKTFMLSEKGFPRFWEITKKLADSINWSKVKKAIEDLADALTILAELTWTALMDFYEDFLVPIGTWTMNEALPKLASWMKTVAERLKKSNLLQNLRGLWKILSKFATDVGTGLIDFFTGMADVALDYILSLDWETFNSALGHLLDIIATVAVDIGKGIVNFFSDLQPVATWLTNAFVKLLDGLFGNLSFLVDNASESGSIETFGYALGGALTAILCIKATQGIVSIISGIGPAISTLITTVTSHPYLAAATAIGMIAAAIVKIVSSAKSADQGWYDDFYEGLDKITSKVDETKTNIDNLEKRMETFEIDSNADATYLKELADRYYALEQGAGKSQEAIEEQQKIAEQLAQKMGVGGKFGIAINEETGLIETQKDEVYKNIQALKDKADFEALWEMYREAVKQEAEAQRDYAVAREATDDAYAHYVSAQSKMPEGDDLLREVMSGNISYALEGSEAGRNVSNAKKAWQDAAENSSQAAKSWAKIKKDQSWINDKINSISVNVDTTTEKSGKNIQKTSKTAKNSVISDTKEIEAKVPPLLEKAGDGGRDRFASSIADSEKGLSATAEKEAKKAGEKAAGNKTKAIFKESGEDDASEFTGGFKSEIGDKDNGLNSSVKESGKDAAGDKTKAIFKEAGEDSGDEFNKGFKSEITDKKDGIKNSVNTEMENLSDKAKDTGKDYAANWLEGVEDEIAKSHPNFRVKDDGEVIVDVKGKKGKAKKKAHGGIFARGSWRDLPHYADGMPYGVRGSLFIAGEAGPEIVAQGRSGSSEILNASQIASAIYSAVSSAMKGSNGNVTVKLMGDANRLFDVIVEKNNKNTLITNHNALLG